MREQPFRTYAERYLTGGSPGSYLSYLRRVERDLCISLDACDLSDSGIEALLVRLAASGAPAKSVGNCRSALRSYAAFAMT